MFRIAALLVLLVTAADAVGAGRYAVCPMLRSVGREEPGCGHCPPAPDVAIRDGLPDCCALHAAVRPPAAPAEEASRITRQGPTLAVVPTLMSVPVPEARRGESRPLSVHATAPPVARNLPLLR